MEPFFQGSFDSYCGIYSVINATNMLVKDLDCEELFAKIIKTIGPKLSRMTLNGITLSELQKYVLKPSAEHLQKKNIELQYITAKANSLDEYWNVIQNHYEENGSGSLIIGMIGVREHWTCVKNVTNKTIVFSDSGVLDRIYRAYITIGEPTKKRKHVFLPEETFLLSIK